jgi:peptidyl-Lys metalloendopeptidase
MFAIITYVVLRSLILSAEIVFATPSLSLHISGPRTVDGIENLKLITTVANTGDSTLQLLKDPRGVLSTMPTHKFVIRNAVGDEPLFTGAIINNGVADSANVVQDKGDLTILPPGESIDVEHDCTSSQDLEEALLIKPSPSVRNI